MAANMLLMEKHLFNLKFAVKELQRNSLKCNKKEKIERTKTKQAIMKGNVEVARIHAENAIRQKNEGINYLRMSVRVDAVANRVQTALTTRRVTNSMTGVVKSLDVAIRSNNLERITALMDKFDQQFEEMDVQTGVMESDMARSTTTSAPAHQVDTLIQEVADEAGLELNLELPPSIDSLSAPSPILQEQDELSQRLARLRH